MRQFHYNLIAFLLTLVVTVSVVEYRLSKNTKTYVDLKYEEVYSPKVNADNVIFGNSHAGGIDPTILDNDEYTYYNFYFGGGSPTYYKIWYNNVFKENYPKPKYVIYTVDWVMFDKTWSRTIDADIRLVSFPAFINIILNEPNINKKRLISNYSFLVTKPNQLQHVFYPKIRKDVIKYKNGFFPVDKKNAVMGVGFDSIVVDNRLKNDFEGLLNILERDSVQVIFVSIPEYIPAWKTDAYIEVYQYLDSIAVNRDIPYLNYNVELKSEMNYDSTCFNDWIHLNSKGAINFSKMLSSDLKQLIE